MDVVHPRCAGIDCSKKDAKVCVRIQGQGHKRASSTVTTWGATTSRIMALREHLLAEKVTCVVIESTSDYWKPFYYLLDDALDMMLVNASRVRNVAGRNSLALEDLEVTLSELFDWYQDRFETIQGSLDSHAEALGYQSAREFLSDVMTEYHTQHQHTPPAAGSTPVVAIDAAA
jgi:hypothetical protein